MKILVISDSHKNTSVLDKILLSEQTCSEVFFLGDVTDDIEDFRYIYPEKNFHIVSGNCDFYSFFPNVGLECIEGVNIIFTHGHTYNVKYGTESLLSAAIARNCKLALYGHTHIPSIDIKNGIFLVNPGSCSQSRGSGETYAVIDITNGKIYPEIKKI